MLSIESNAGVIGWQYDGNANTCLNDAMDVEWMASKDSTSGITEKAPQLEK